MAKMGGSHCGKIGWNLCYRQSDENGWGSLWQKWVELSMTKMGGTHCGKNWWNWCYRHREKKWVELTVEKMVGALNDKNGWNSLWQKWVELVL